ncbi:hypothetical protein Ddye_021484 [Dipteronia dyeriana]|uniref:Reverse transcriptase zinc-binding domain-containing protein n=1 Tax=Dipteronia dyeriana TaxID=168575 RepID=A0AAD9WWD3_9ROSI|nr:hypothetical protein Ddye_021484 [Dipteronia dyeriana]
MADFSHLLPISSLRGFSALTHLLYVDDVQIYFRGTVRNLKNIMNAFEVYGNISGQLVNWGKSSIYFGSSVSLSRIGKLQSLVGMQIGRLLFSYLGVQLFLGKPKKSVLQPIADKILSKFAKWKWKALSLAGHGTLIKLVITGCFVHSFMIYKWPSSLLRLANRKLRIFLWIGSCEKTKLIRVAWGRCCKLYSHGGLGLKDLGLLNDSLLKKLTKKFMTFESFVFSFLREQYLWQLQKSHGGMSLRRFGLLSTLIIQIFSKRAFGSLISVLGSIGLLSLHLQILWCGHILGMGRFFTSRLIHVSFVILQDRLCRIGFHLASRCSVCGVSSESSDHLFFRCPLAADLWEAVFSAFQRCISTGTWSSIFSQAMSVSFSNQVCILWKTTTHVVVWSVWLARNQWIFEGKAMDFRSALSFVWRAVSDANRLEIGYMRNYVDDLLIFHRFDLRSRPARALVIRIWSPPAPGWTKVNTDGAVFSSPGAEGCGDIFRNCKAFVKGCLAIPLDHVFAFEAELLAASIAINFAWQNGWHRI